MGAPGSPAVEVIVSGDGMTLQESVDYAVSLEDAGFDGVWFPEIQREPFVALAAVAARTSRLRLGTGVANWSRSPLTTALTAANLDQLSDGRFTLGIGTGPPAWNEDFHGIAFERPVQRMREYLDVMRGVWRAHSGAALTYAGERFQVRGYARTIPQERERIPILLAAVQSGMLQLAGAAADGVLLNVCTTPRYYEDVAFPNLRAGARRAGRRFEDVRRASIVCVAIDDDAAQAREWARRHIAFYGALPYFDLILGLHGFGEQAVRLRNAAAGGDLAAQLAAVDDEMVETLTLAGTPDHVRRRLRDYAGWIETAVLFAPGFATPSEEIAANYAAIRATFAA